MGKFRLIRIMKLNFIFQSEPKAIQSARFANIGGFIRSYQPKANKDWKNWIRLQAQMHLPDNFTLINEPIAITKLHFVFKPLKSFPKYKIKQIMEGGIIYKHKQPDLTDNLSKGLIDALTGLVWHDDALIVAEDNVKKYYGLEACIVLEIETINNGG